MPLMILANDELLIVSNGVVRIKKNEYKEDEYFVVVETDGEDHVLYTSNKKECDVVFMLMVTQIQVGKKVVRI